MSTKASGKGPGVAGLTSRSSTGNELVGIKINGQIYNVRVTRESEAKLDKLEAAVGTPMYEVLAQEDFMLWLSEDGRVPGVKRVVKMVKATGGGVAAAPQPNEIRTDEEMFESFIATQQATHLRNFADSAVVANAEAEFAVWKTDPNRMAYIAEPETDAKNSLDIRHEITDDAHFVNLYMKAKVDARKAAERDVFAAKRFANWEAAADRHRFLNLDGSETEPEDVRRIFGEIEMMTPVGRATAYGDLDDIRWNGQKVVSVRGEHVLAEEIRAEEARRAKEAENAPKPKPKTGTSEAPSVSVPPKKAKPAAAAKATAKGKAGTPAPGIRPPTRTDRVIRWGQVAAWNGFRGLLRSFFKV